MNLALRKTVMCLELLFTTGYFYWRRCADFDFFEETASSLQEAIHGEVGLEVWA